MKGANMIPKDFSAAVKDIKLAVLQVRAWLSCFKIRSLPVNGIRHSASDEFHQMASAEFADVSIRPLSMGELGAA